MGTAAALALIGTGLLFSTTFGKEKDGCGPDTGTAGEVTPGRTLVLQRNAPHRLQRIPAHYPNC